MTHAHPKSSKGGVEGERGLGVFEAGFGFVWFGELHLTRESRAFFVFCF